MLHYGITSYYRNALPVSPIYMYIKTIYKKILKFLSIEGLIIGINNVLKTS